MRALIEDSVACLKCTLSIFEEIAIVTKVWFRVLKRYYTAVGVVVLEEICSAQDITGCTRFSLFDHGINVRLETCFLRMERIDNVIRLLHEHLLQLVDTVFKEFHCHSFSCNIDSVRFHESKAEPLRSEALFLKENTCS